MNSARLRARSEHARSEHARGVALAAAWIAVTGGVALASALAACQTHSCDGDELTFGTNPNEGRLLDANTWESGAIDGPWIPFPHARIYHFDLHALGARTPRIILPYLSADPEPIKNVQSTTIGSGNLAEIFSAQPSGVSLRNGTCADYYLRLVVIASPDAPLATTDASVEVDAATDASQDAP